MFAAMVGFGWISFASTRPSHHPSAYQINLRLSLPYTSPVSASRFFWRIQCAKTGKQLLRKLSMAVQLTKMEDITVWALPGSVQLHDIDATDSGLEALIQHDWKATADIQKHVVLLSMEGPCTGVIRQVANNSKGNNDVESGLLQQHFAEGFMDIAVSQWLTNEKMSMLKLQSKDVIPALNSTKFCEETLARELRRFLVCLICGTSLSTADKVLDVGHIVRLTTPYGSLLGVVHKATRLEARKDQLVLLCGDGWYMQGFFISLRTEGGVSVRGRTVIPNKGVWDFLEAFTTSS